MWCFTEGGKLKTFKYLRDALEYRARAASSAYLSPLWYRAVC